MNKWHEAKDALAKADSERERESDCKLITEIHQAQRNVIILRKNSDRSYGRQNN